MNAAPKHAAGQTTACEAPTRPRCIRESRVTKSPCRLVFCPRCEPETYAKGFARHRLEPEPVAAKRQFKALVDLEQTRPSKYVGGVNTPPTALANKYERDERAK